jgi:hypothetical protein
VTRGLDIFIPLKSRLTVVTVCIWFLRIVAALATSHLHGTRVPMEEPSTASEADIGGYLAGAVL